MIKPAKGWPETLFVLAAFIAFCLAVSAAGGWVTAGRVETWYQSLTRPSFTPPDWVFAPVWTTLYVLMAVAAWLVWLRTGWSQGRNLLGLFVLQLILNFAWSVLFFGLQRIDLAFLDLLALWALIAVITVLFWRVERVAGVLLVPYLAWVGFAGVLNGWIWVNNDL